MLIMRAVVVIPVEEGQTARVAHGAVLRLAVGLVEESRVRKLLDELYIADYTEGRYHDPAAEVGPAQEGRLACRHVCECRVLC